MASYKPDIRCNVFPGPPLESCNSIFSDMYVDKNRQTYGHLPDRRVQVQLPITYTSGTTMPLLVHLHSHYVIANRRCMVKIDIKGQPTALTLYEVWEAIVALTSTCVRGRQRCGIASSLGLSSKSEKARTKLANALKVLPATYFFEFPTSLETPPSRWF